MGFCSSRPAHGRGCLRLPRCLWETLPPRQRGSAPQPAPQPAPRWPAGKDGEVSLCSRYMPGVCVGVCVCPAPRSPLGARCPTAACQKPAASISDGASERGPAGLPQEENGKAAALTGGRNRVFLHYKGLDWPHWSQRVYFWSDGDALLFKSRATAPWELKP